MKKFRILSLLILGAFFTACDDEVVEINSTEEFETYLAEEMTAQDVPALAVLIFEGETIKYEKYLGESDVAANQALAPDDIFLMASVSKMITGTAILQLHENGEFGLDDNINDYLPFAVSVPNQSAPITFRNLLTHTSGIEDGPNSDIFYSYGQDSPLDLKTYMERYLVPGGEYYNAGDNFYDYAPGSQHNYSNMASAFIGVIVEEISGQSFQAYCRENIFEPLSMSNTYWSLDEALQSGKTLVNPYELSGNDFELIQHYTFPDYPNGALRSTARDMMKFASALAQEGTFNSQRILNSETVNEMLQAQIPELEATMGLHIFLMDASNNLWGHDGSEQGVSTEVSFNSTNDTGIIVLSNLQDVDVSDIASEAYKLALKL